MKIIYYVSMVLISGCAIGSLYSQTDSHDIFTAVAENNTDKVTELLSSNKELAHARDADGNTPLFFAKNEDAAEKLLDGGSDPNARNRYGVTPLDWAARKGYDKTVARLIKDGADVNSTDEEGITPLHVAASWGREDITHRLLKAGADVNAGDTSGQTPLHKAAFMGRDKVAEILLDSGARVSRDKSGMTPFDLAKRYGQQKVVSVFNKAMNKQEL